MFLFCLFDLGCKQRKREQVKLAKVCVEFCSPFQKPKKKLSHLVIFINIYCLFDLECKQRKRQQVKLAQVNYSALFKNINPTRKGLASK